MEQFIKHIHQVGVQQSPSTRPGEGIKQVNKQPPNHPNCNIILIVTNSIVPTTPASNEGNCIENEGVGASGFFFSLPSSCRQTSVSTFPCRDMTFLLLQLANKMSAYH